MAEMAPRNNESSSGLTKQLAIGLLESVTALWSLCTEQATRASRHCTKQANRASRRLAIECRNQASRASRRLASFQSTSQQPKQLLAAISNKAIQLRQKKRLSQDQEAKGGGGVWQRTIMMGDKCQPLDFPGVIYYDSNGNRLSELPMKSPRASPLPSFAYKATSPKQ